MILIFFDIETIQIWNIDEKIKEKYGDKINFMPEFNEIFTICVGKIMPDGTKSIKAIKWTEEEQLLEFVNIIAWNKLCGYNILWFDIPFIIKRMLKYQITIPNILKTYWVKPREINHIDLFDVRKCGVFWWNWNLDIVCKHLWIVSPKEEWIDGSMVSKMVLDWRGDEVMEYCKRDVLATIKLYNYFKEYNLI